MQVKYFHIFLMSQHFFAIGFLITQSDYFPVDILNGSKRAKHTKFNKCVVSVQIRVLQQNFLDTKFLRGSFKRKYTLFPQRSIGPNWVTEMFKVQPGSFAAAKKNYPAHVKT